jgi:hypothetical protein
MTDQNDASVTLPPAAPATAAITVDDATPQFITSPTIGKLAMALARVQKVLKQPTKGADNPFFKSKYADLHEVWAAASVLLATEGVAVVQSPSFRTAQTSGGSPANPVVKTIGVVSISTTLIHGESGEWMTNVLKGTTENIGPQAIGSAISYFRRYSLQPLLMLTPDDGSDDDAEKAEGRSAAPTEDKPTADDIAKHTAAIKGAITLESLKTVYANIPEAHRKVFNKLVNARKGAIEALTAKPLGQPLTNPDEAHPEDEHLKDGI